MAENYYRKLGAAAIHDQLPQLERGVAVDLAGSRSDCYGYDEVSKGLEELYH